MLPWFRLVTPARGHHHPHGYHHCMSHCDGRHKTVAAKSFHRHGGLCQKLVYSRSLFAVRLSGIASFVVKDRSVASTWAGEAVGLPWR